LWAPALCRFRVPDGRLLRCPAPSALGKRRSRLRSIAALQDVADFGRGFPNFAPAFWSAVVGASPLPLSFAGWAFIEVSRFIRARKAAKSLRSIAAVQDVADFACGFPNFASVFWSAVVGVSSLPLPGAGRALIEVSSSIRARKAAKSLALHRRTPRRRRLRVGLPEFRASVLDRTIRPQSQ
jgi:hypothetical protein